MLKRTAAAVCAACILALPAQAGAVRAASPAVQYLESQPPGAWSLAISALEGLSPREEAEQAFHNQLDNGLENGFSSSLSLEQAIISLEMLGGDAQDYQNRSLVAALSTMEGLYEEGLEAACFALIAYQAADATVLETARNSIPALTDFIVSSQQRDGGFAPVAGRTASARSTAFALLALAPQQELPYVKSSVNRAIAWLSQQQNSDGSFSELRQPSGAATAAVLTTLRVYGIEENDPRFFKEAGISKALEQFQNPDGGYAPHIGGRSAVSTTEQAVFALYADKTGLSPYLASVPAVSPDGAPDTAPVAQKDSVAVYLRFLLSFLAMLAIIYGLLILTTKIGKKWGGHIPKFRNPYALEESEAPFRQNDTQTLEINIPMKAEMPNFDEIGEPPIPPPSAQSGPPPAGEG